MTKLDFSINLDSKSRKLKYGEIHFFNPFTIETDKSFNELCKAIDESNLVFTNTRHAHIKNQINSMTAQIAKDLQKKGIRVQLEKNKEENNAEELDFDEYDALEDDLLLEIEHTENGIRTTVKSEKENVYVDSVRKMEEEIELAERLYGTDFLGSHVRFPLVPFKVELENSKEVWTRGLLYLFKNKIAILKIELPLVDVTFDNMFDNDIDQYVINIEDNWQLLEGVDRIEFSDLHKVYIKTLCEDVSVNLWSYGHVLKNIILVDYEGIPKTLEKIDSKLEEDLFRVVCAPVPKGNKKYYREKAKEYIESKSWGSNEVNYIIKSTGGCVSTIGSNVLKKTPISYISVSRDISVNVEYAILVTILKKTIKEYDYLSKKYKNGTLFSFRERYNQDIIFLCELQRYAYGTVLEQTIFFQKSMPHYLDEELSTLKLKALDTILDDEERERNNRFQNIIAKGGIVLTMVFSLPAINESIEIIRTAFYFVKKDIPFVSIKGVSALMWCALCLFILIYFRERYQNVDSKREQTLVCMEVERKLLNYLESKEFVTMKNLCEICNLPKRKIKFAVSRMLEKDLIEKKTSIKGIAYQLKDVDLDKKRNI